MVEVPSPLEGAVVLLSYTECDYEAENTVCLVYTVTEGELQPLHGIVDLPEAVSGWEPPSYENESVVLSILASVGAVEVFTPLACLSSEKFLGMNIGYFDISEGVNAKGEVECWGEFKGIDSGDCYEWLIEAGITILFVDPETMEIYQD